VTRHQTNALIYAETNETSNFSIGDCVLMCEIDQCTLIPFALTYLFLTHFDWIPPEVFKCFSENHRDLSHIVGMFFIRFWLILLWSLRKSPTKRLSNTRGQLDGMYHSKMLKLYFTVAKGRMIIIYSLPRKKRSRTFCYGLSNRV
jgi:hypothetical protein